MIETLEAYLAELDEPARTWVAEFTDYVGAAYPSLQVTMFRQRPMFKFGRTYTDGYVMFTAAKSHFTLHAIEFDLIEAFRPRLPRASFGKGSIKVKFGDVDAKPVLREFVDQVMARHGVARAG